MYNHLANDGTQNGEQTSIFLHTAENERQRSVTIIQNCILQFDYFFAKWLQCLIHSIAKSTYIQAMDHSLCEMKKVALNYHKIYIECFIIFCAQLKPFVSSLHVEYSRINSLMKLQSLATSNILLTSARSPGCKYLSRSVVWKRILFLYFKHAKDLVFISYLLYLLFFFSHI